MREVSRIFDPAWRVMDRMRRGAEVPVVLCIDVEPDPRVYDPSEPPAWLGFESLLREMPALRDRLESATGRPAKFCWFIRMDPQIEDTWGTASWAADAYGDALAELVDGGDEIGLHSHIWRLDQHAAEWVADYRDTAWSEHCLEVGLDAFEKGFGRSCEAHRAGDHYLTSPMLSVLSDRQVRVDLSLEPGWTEMEGLGRPGERVDGTIPDYREVPADPYRATPASFPAPDPGGEGPLLVPLLTAPSRRPPFRRLTLTPVHAPTVFASRLALEMLRNPPVIAIAMRTDSVICHHWDYMQENLIHLARRRGIAFETASAVADRFEREVAQPA
jgi:hypothetical protein